MLPTVRDGECVTVEPMASRPVALGDVVLCETWRGPVAHRVLAIDAMVDGGRRFTLRGDASLESDRPVTAGQLRGRLVSVERDGLVLSLLISGGALGRALFVASLHLRPVLAEAVRAVRASRWLLPAAR